MTSRSLAGVAACVVICLLAAGCSSTASVRVEAAPPVNVAGTIIRNALAYVVTDVVVKVPATGRFVGCGNVLPRTECRTSFPAIEYQGNALVVAWQERGVSQSTDEFIVELPPSAQPGDSFWLEVVIYSTGLAGARLVQP